MGPGADAGVRAGRWEERWQHSPRPCQSVRVHSSPTVRAEVSRSGFPALLRAMVYTNLRGPRVVKLEGVCSEVVRTSTSIVAGCSAATTMLRVILLQSCDSFTTWSPQVRMKVVVDDISLQAIGSEGEVPPTLARAANKMVDMLQGDLQAEVSVKKSLALGSSAAVEKAICERLRHKLATARSAKNLGVDFGCRGRIAVTQKLRNITVAKRCKRHQFIKRDKGDAAKLVKTGAVLARGVWSGCK